MNERIKELSDIAYKNHLARNPNSSFGRRSDYDKEFAELIIKETLQVAKAGVEFGPSMEEAVYAYFGVKE
jgi:hypothetical protein